MNNKKIMKGLIIILIFSLACAAIYATGTTEVSHSDSSQKHEGFYISGSGDVSNRIDSASQDYYADHDSLLSIYV